MRGDAGWKVAWAHAGPHFPLSVALEGSFLPRIVHQPRAPAQAALEGAAPIEGAFIWMSWSRDGNRAIETVSNRVSDIVLLRNFDPVENR